MATDHSAPDDARPRSSDRVAEQRSWPSLLARLLLLFVMVAVGGGASVYWLTNKPTAQRRPPEAQATLVEVAQVASSTERVVVQAMGTVVPAQVIELSSRVSGEIVQVSPEFVPGGRFRTGERILQVEPRDYQLAVQQRESDLAKAECDLKVELGQQSVAEREYQLLGQEVAEEDRELVLRQPQLAMTRAAVSAAQAALEQARLDLERTDILAPFSAMVQSREADLGSQVSVGSALASLVGTDKYWVQASVPLGHLKWVSIPGVSGQQGSAARIYDHAAWGGDVCRLGTVERLMADLEPEGRMARLLVAVKDPLGLESPSAERPPLVLGAYVRVEIDGHDLTDVIRVPRTALRDGDRVWVMKEDDTLDIRGVEIAWSGNDHVYISEGLADGDLLVTSDLAAPVQGMELRTAGSSQDRASEDSAREEGQP